MAEYIQQYDWRSTTTSHDIYKHYAKHQTKDHRKCLDALRHQIRNVVDFELRNNLPQDDKTLLKFLYARKFDIEETYQLLQNYHSYRKRNVELFKNLDVTAPDIVKALEAGLPGVLSSKDRKGRCVVFLNATNWDCNSYTLFTIYRSIWLSFEHLAEDVYNQSRGFVIIVDWTEFSFRQSTNLKPSTLKQMIEGLQDCFPARFKGIHFIGQPWYVDTALTFIKPFLKEKIKDRIYAHGNNLSTLHDYVHKDILPAELGGEQPSYNPETWLDILRKHHKSLSQ